VSKAQNTNPSAAKEATSPSSMVAPTAVAQAATQAGACLGKKKDGGVCGATPGQDGYCCHHSPRYNADQRRVWARRGAAAVHLQTAAKARAALAQEIAAVAPTLPAGTPLPPTPAEEIDWSDATKIRLYLQRLGAQVVRGEIPASVAKTLKELCDSALRVVDAELDAELMGQLDDEDEE